MMMMMMTMWKRRLLNEPTDVTNLVDGVDMDASVITTEDDVAVVGRRRGSWRLLETPWALLNEELDRLTL